MRYVRTKDGRIVEECNLEPGLKQTCITLIRKRDNKTLTQIICDDMDNYVEMIVVGEYCKCHKINPKDIKLERIALLNEILKQSDNLEDLCDDFVLYDEEAQQYVTLEKGFYHRLNIECKKALHLVNKYIYGAIWIVGDNKEPILKSVAKMNNEGDLVLL